MDRLNNIDYKKLREKVIELERWCEEYKCAFNEIEKMLLSFSEVDRGDLIEHICQVCSEIKQENYIFNNLALEYINEVKRICQEALCPKDESELNRIYREFFS